MSAEEMYRRPVGQRDQGNANQNHTEALPHPCENGSHHKTREPARKMWRNWNP